MTYVTIEEVIVERKTYRYRVTKEQLAEHDYDLTSAVEDLDAESVKYDVVDSEYEIEVVENSDTYYQWRVEDGLDMPEEV